MLSGLDKQLLVNLGGYTYVGYKHAKCRDHLLGSLLQSCQGCQGASCYHSIMLAAVEDIRLKPDHTT